MLQNERLCYISCLVGSIVTINFFNVKIYKYLADQNKALTELNYEINQSS